MRHWRAFSAKAIWLAAIVLLTSCSLVRLGYNHGETLSYWWLNAYADITREQNPWVRQSIADLFAWHRKTQLRDYVQFLSSAQKQLRTTVTKADVLTDFDGIKERAALVIDKAIPDLADFALTLDQQQITHIEKKFASNNDAYRRDYLRGNLEQRQLSRFKKVMEQAEYWFGDFNRDQLALIRRASDERLLDSELLLRERQYRQQQMIALLKRIRAEKPSRDATIRILRDYAATMFEHAGGGEHERIFNASRDGAAVMAAVIINSATPAQKAHAHKRLQQWIDNFSTLAMQRD
ncbi:MAG TPA: DUF6279 family lipoprotein [Paucimonas sp.]|nr:DUF6279 family lipoprotein [Paucimonas sp.]HJW57985.1 DUF6279 family lipoprotein [Burkholderiaceae bacterium]